nr:MAG TPA: hypothetical protein [Caudoviricetes sp.]
MLFCYSTLSIYSLDTGSRDFPPFFIREVAYEHKALLKCQP